MTARRRVHIGNDHGGVALRQVIADTLTQLGCEIASNLGPRSSEEAIDYPDVAASIAKLVGRDPASFGILICGTGQGVAMTANRRAGIRAGVVADTFSARMLREHNDANILCMGARVVGPGLAADIVRSFVEASFSGNPRHRRRVDKIDAPVVSVRPAGSREGE